MPAQAGQGDGLECEDQQTDQQRYPYRAAVDGDFRRDASDGAPDGCRRLIGGILAGQRRFAVCLLLVAQRVGERHGRLSDQRLRVGWGEVLVVVGYLRLFRRRIERDPAVAFEIDLHPCFDVVAGEFDGRGAVDRFGAVVADVAVVVLGQEAHDHAGWQAEFAGHQRHGGGILLAVADHRGSSEQRVDAIAAMSGQRRIVAGQAVREPTRILELRDQRLRLRAGRVLAARHRRGELAHRVRHVLGARLVGDRRVGLGDLLVGGCGGDDAAFRIGHAGGQPGRDDGRLRALVVVEERVVGGGSGFAAAVSVGASGLSR